MRWSARTGTATFRSPCPSRSTAAAEPKPRPAVPATIASMRLIEGVARLVAMAKGSAQNVSLACESPNPLVTGRTVPK
jgi:hypothetical protein